ncbi:MAG: hypothetical protein ACE5H9_01870 [Anaerolineae bacterium]
MKDTDLKRQLEGQLSEVNRTRQTPGPGEVESNGPLRRLFSAGPAAPQHPPAACPYLGLADDRDSRFSFPEGAHRCYVAEAEDAIPLEHQVTYCFSRQHPTCSRFGQAPAGPEPASPEIRQTSGPDSEEAGFLSPGRVLLWGLALALAVFTVAYYARAYLPGQPATEPTPQAASGLFATPSPTPPAEVFTVTGPTPTPAFLAAPTAIPTPVPGGRIYTLSPAAADIGWVVSGEERGNHFGDSYLYSGIFEGQVYHGAFQFDLSSIPRGAPIHSASLHLTGLRDDRLGEGGVWTLRLLTPEVDQGWRRRDYQAIFNAPTLQTLNPILGNQDLAVGRPNIFELSSMQVRLLEQRIVDDEDPAVSFRLDGPLVGSDNLFAWDTGYGPQSLGNAVVLFLNVGPPPATPPPYDYVVVTSTPTPENVVTAAAIALQMTAEATRIGTATPPPPNMVTATPIPDNLVITATPTPENAATAQALAALATAYALTTGTPTPIPANAVTATPTASATPTPTWVLITATPTPESVLAAATMSAAATVQTRQHGTPTPLPSNWVTPVFITPTPTPANRATAQARAVLATAQAFTTGTPTPLPPNAVIATPMPYVLITATPTPESVLAAATLSAAATTQAHQVGAPTPLPSNWVTPVVITATPTPANRATAQALAALATARAFTTGTPTPLPPNVVTATPTPIFIVLDGQYPPLTPSPAPTFQPGPVPAALIGKIAFKSDRSGQEEIYVINPDGSGLALLSDRWPYDLARQADAYSADGRFRVFTKEAIRYGTAGDRIDAPALFWYDAYYRVERQLTLFGTGLAYDGAWSPAAERIAFVTNDSQNDEIWVVNRDGSGLRQLTQNDWAWDKHPSWSPDGRQIVFWSNRTGHGQIWVMDADGGNVYSLSRTEFNDWDPVWIKYPDVPEYEAGEGAGE